MHPKTSLISALLLLLGALALVATGFPSHTSAGRAANSQGAPTKTVTVAIRSFKFEPATLTVNQGDIVEWKNDDIVPHTATEDGNAEKPVFDSGAIARGAAWRFVAHNKGTYDYICTFHPNMEGRLIVQ